VDAEVRRRLHVAREAAAALRVAERARPLHTRRRIISLCFNVQANDLTNRGIG
jgi:hypothetical protein